MSKRLVSLIVPARNEEGNLPRVYKEVNDVTLKLSDKYDFEILVIDNDSTDSTGKLACSFCEKDPRWRYIKFSRNFGSEASIAAGMSYAKGDACIILFSDLQDPPEDIPRLLEQWEAGFDIVYGIYGAGKHERWLKRLFVAAFYRVLSNLAEIPMVPFAGDFRLYDRRVMNVLCQMKEKNRYMRGLAQWVGFRTTSIKYTRRPRIAGKSHAPFMYLFGFGFSVIVNFSDKPLRFFAVSGISLAGVAVLMLGGLVVNYFYRPVVPGLTTTHALLVLNLAVTSLGFGVVGEYIAKIYRETKARPIWIVDKAVNFDRDIDIIGY